MYIAVFKMYIAAFKMYIATFKMYISAFKMYISAFKMYIAAFKMCGKLDDAAFKINKELFLNVHFGSDTTIVLAELERLGGHKPSLKHGFF